MGVELELAVLLALSIVGQSTFGVFETETPAWRKVLKWGLITTLTLWVFSRAGHWALLVPGLGALAGMSFHIWWCRRNGIDLLRATPRQRYYALRGWSWPDGRPGDS